MENVHPALDPRGVPPAAPSAYSTSSRLAPIVSTTCIPVLLETKARAGGPVLITLVGLGSVMTRSPGLTLKVCDSSIREPRRKRGW